MLIVTNLFSSQSLPSFLQKKVRKYWETIGSNNLDTVLKQPQRNGYIMAETEIK